MEKEYVIGVDHLDIAAILSHGLSLLPCDKSKPVNLVALLLACAELAILMASDDWSMKANQAVTIAKLREMAFDQAWCVYHEFKDSEVSEGSKKGLSVDFS